MAKKVIKKVDVKKVAKLEVMEAVKRTFEGVDGFEVLDGVDFGMTAGTVIIRTATCDVQLKPITPKAGINHYESAIEEEEIPATETDKEGATPSE